MNYLRQFYSQPKTSRTTGTHRNCSNGLLATLPSGMETCHIGDMHDYAARQRLNGLGYPSGIETRTFGLIPLLLYHRQAKWPVLPVRDWGKGNIKEGERGRQATFSEKAACLPLSLFQRTLQCSGSVSVGCSVPSSLSVIYYDVST